MKRSDLFPGFLDQTFRLQRFWLLTSNFFNAFRRPFSRFSVGFSHKFLYLTFLYHTSGRREIRKYLHTMRRGIPLERSCSILAIWAEALRAISTQWSL